MRTAIREAYDAWHAAFEAHRETDAPWHTLVRGHLDPQRDVAGKRLLEIGCGSGGFACWLAAHPAGPRQIVAADLSHVAVSRGRAQALEVGAPGIQWEVADIERLAYPSATFDTVISCETIEHLHHPYSGVAELARVLRPGGRLFLTTPNYFGSMGIYRFYVRVTGRRYTEIGQPINQLTLWPRTLSWVRRAGLRIRATDGTGHYLPFPGRPPIRFRVLDRANILTRWTALHSFILAEKPS